MPGPLFLSITLRNHASGIVPARISRDPNAPNQPIKIYKPIYTSACASANHPVHNPIKLKRKRETTTQESIKREESDGSGEHDNSKVIPPATRSKTDEGGEIIKHYSAGGLLQDPDALKHPTRYTEGQVRWAEAMAGTLLGGARQRRESARIRCEQILGDECDRIMEGIEAEPIELIDEPIIRFVAFTGAHLFSAGNEEASLPSYASCQKLGKKLQLLRDELGMCKELEKIIEEREEDDD